MFDEDHPVRVWVYERITTKQYDYVMLVLIVLNCMLMALENPRVEPSSTLGLLLYWSDVGFTIVFGIEVLVKSFAFTFNLYIREITNQASRAREWNCIASYSNLTTHPSIVCTTDRCMPAAGRFRHRTGVCRSAGTGAADRECIHPHGASRPARAQATAHADPQRWHAHCVQESHAEHGRHGQRIAVLSHVLPYLRYPGHSALHGPVLEVRAGVAHSIGTVFTELACAVCLQHAR